jgi:2,3,4,5-tetrahydropyridine-2-carboxylate N-succinyltransferase
MMQLAGAYERHHRTGLGRPGRINPANAAQAMRAAVEEVIAGLDAASCASRKSRARMDHAPVDQEAVLLSFRLEDNRVMEGGATATSTRCRRSSIPLISQGGHPRGAARAWPARGSYIARNAVLMPSYVNVGAYVDEGTMVDTWATVGSCAQIGKNVHLSGGVGIGGVLEPLQANPTIIEDNCFIGARSEVVEGVIVEENSVLSMGVFIGQSTKIFDRESGEILYGRVPAGSVVVAGTCPRVTQLRPLLCNHREKSGCEDRAKTSLNELLRGD